MQSKGNSPMPCFITPAHSSSSAECTYAVGEDPLVMVVVEEEQRGKQAPKASRHAPRHASASAENGWTPDPHMFSRSRCPRTHKPPCYSFVEPSTSLAVCLVSLSRITPSVVLTVQQIGSLPTHSWQCTRRILRPGIKRCTLAPQSYRAYILATSRCLEPSFSLAATAKLRRGSRSNCMMLVSPS